MNPPAGIVRTDVMSGLRQLAVLPEWLTAPDGSVVGKALAPFADRFGGTIVGCRRHAVRMRTGYWECRYDVRVQHGSETVKHLLTGELRPPGADLAESAGDIVLADLGLSLRVAATATVAAGDSTSDPALPALAVLLDPDRAARLIEAALGAADPRSFTSRIVSCQPEVMRYKPGSRCTLRYHLDYSVATAAPRMVVAKTHHGDKGLVAWRAMTALWDTPLAAGEVVSIAQPLSYDPAQRILLQGPVAGETTLKKITRDALVAPTRAAVDRVEMLLDATADGLVALHRCGAAADEEVGLADDLAEARNAWSRLTSLVPEIGGAADGLFAEVERIAATALPDPLVPSHRSFRPAQVLVDGDRIAVIDFDGFCRSEPALDVALFRATLRCYGASLPLADDGALEDRLDVLDEWCERFSSRYQSRAAVSAERVAAWELLDIFVHLQNAWTKARPARPATALAVLERLLAR